MSNHSVYVYRDRAGRVLYVGRSNSVVRRAVEHKGKQWWAFVSYARVFHFSSEQLASSVEVALIKKMRPVFNIQHNGGVDHSYEPPPERDSYAELRDMIDGLCRKCLTRPPYKGPDNSGRPICAWCIPTSNERRAEFIEWQSAAVMR